MVSKAGASHVTNRAWAATVRLALIAQPARSICLDSNVWVSAAPASMQFQASATAATEIARGAVTSRTALRALKDFIWSITDVWILARLGAIPTAMGLALPVMQLA